MEEMEDGRERKRVQENFSCNKRSSREGRTKDCVVICWQACLPLCIGLPCISAFGRYASSSCTGIATSTAYASGLAVSSSYHVIFRAVPCSLRIGTENDLPTSRYSQILRKPAYLGVLCVLAKCCCTRTCFGISDQLPAHDTADIRAWRMIKAIQETDA
jgi:hypothetical protein